MGEEGLQWLLKALGGCGGTTMVIEGCGGCGGSQMGLKGFRWVWKDYNGY